jgi:hypothetical protein
MEIATLLYLSGALTGTVVGDALDPLSLSEEESKDKPIIQELCETTTTTDSNGLVSKVESCKTYKTIK